MKLSEAIFKCEKNGVIYRKSKPYNMYWMKHGDIIQEIASKDSGGLNADDWTTGGNNV